MELSENQVKLAIGVLVLVVIGIGYLLWTRSASPDPTPIAGQSILAPMGAPKAGQGQDLGMLPPAARRMNGGPPNGAMPSR